MKVCRRLDNDHACMHAGHSPLKELGSSKGLPTVIILKDILTPLCRSVTYFQKEDKYIPQLSTNHWLRELDGLIKPWEICQIIVSQNKHSLI